jgi:cytochrome c peroxidase
VARRPTRVGTEETQFLGRLSGGSAFSESGSYDRPSEPDSETSGAKGREWRTPPLWGFRDSAPYPHDGRAGTLEEAVTLHGGQAVNSAKRFLKVLPEERLGVQAFLRSLTLPPWPPAGAARSVA